jgi:predicted dehydrogenase
MPGNLTWNRYWDFGNGIIGDMGSHLIDLPYWALGLNYPTSAHAASPTPNPLIYPDWLTVNWEHPKRGNGPAEQACTLTWYDGAKKPNNLHGVDLKKYGIGALFVGTKGLLLADYGKRTIYPLEGDPIITPTAPKQTIKKSIGHHKEWLAACKGDPTATLCNFDYSGKLIEHNLLGTVSHKCGNKKLQWDAANMKATNAPEADKFIHKAYRKGWGFEDVS